MFHGGEPRGKFDPAAAFRRVGRSAFCLLARGWVSVPEGRPTELLLTERKQWR